MVFRCMSKESVNDKKAARVIGELEMGELVDENEAPVMEREREGEIIVVMSYEALIVVAEDAKHRH